MESSVLLFLWSKTWPNAPGGGSLRCSNGKRNGPSLKTEKYYVEL